MYLVFFKQLQNLNGMEKHSLLNIQKPIISEPLFQKWMQEVHPLQGLLLLLLITRLVPLLVISIQENKFNSYIIKNAQLVLELLEQIELQLLHVNVTVDLQKLMIIYLLVKQSVDISVQPVPPMIQKNVLLVKIQLFQLLIVYILLQVILFKKVQMKMVTQVTNIYNVIKNVLVVQVLSMFVLMMVVEENNVLDLIEMLHSIVVVLLDFMIITDKIKIVQNVLNIVKVVFPYLNVLLVKIY